MDLGKASCQRVSSSAETHLATNLRDDAVEFTRLFISSVVTLCKKDQLELFIER